MNTVQIPPSVSDNSKGKYGVSIGTSTALEGIFGVHDTLTYTKDNPKPYKRFSNLVINIRTLFRNLISSVNSEAVKLITPEAALALVIEEIRVIREVVISNSNRKLKVFWYAEMYPEQLLQYRFSKANIKKAKTEIQVGYSDLENNMFNLLQSKIEDKSIYDEVLISDRWFDFNLTTNLKPSIKHLDTRVETTLVLTHLPLDLLLLPLTRMALLESHTGKVKSQGIFHTKLKGKPEHMPFDLMTIQMFGESGEMFSPQPIGVRKELLKIAKAGGWNPTTSRAKIKEDCKNKGDSNVTSLVRQMYKSG